MIVQPINRSQYYSWIMHKHYAKTMPCIQHAFGLFIDGTMQGACTFGTPPTCYNNGAFIFKQLRLPVYELNRLCVMEALPKNTLSKFVSLCIGRMPAYCCLLSYADHSFGHYGYIYQATNWVYTGLNTVHARQVQYNGQKLHPKTAFERFNKGLVQLAETDRNLQLGDYTEKHRYIMFRGTKKQRRQMTRELLLPVLPYPKGDNTRYDSGKKIPQSINLFI